MSTITFDRKPGGALTGLKVERGKQKFVAERMSDQDS
jgi:hypothetical protein